MANYSIYINSTGTHYISNSGSDERGQYHGGQSGDQTGKEWQLRNWYSRPWSVVLRWPDIRVGLKIAELGCAAALNDNIGYDQYQRTTYWNQLVAANYDPSAIRVPCEQDCTCGVTSNTKAVGVLLGISSLANLQIDTYSANMRSRFVAAGFKALTDSKYLSSPNYLLPGDILLYEGHHAATNITYGKYVDKSQYSDSDDQTSACTVEGLRRGDAGSDVRAMQRLLLAWNANCLPRYGADGDFGAETENALGAFQNAMGLTVTGIYDETTRNVLVGINAEGKRTDKNEAIEYRKATNTTKPATIWDYLMKQIGNAYGVAGLMGNLKAESALKSTNLQGSYETKLGYTDDSYTEAVDNGKYTKFGSDSAGYGLAQWTSSGRKQNLLTYAHETNSSIGNLQMQLEFLIKELNASYKTVMSVLKNAKSVREASDSVLLKYEIPADRSESVQIKRASYGQEYYDKYAKSTSGSTIVTNDKEIYLSRGNKGSEVTKMQKLLLKWDPDCLPRYGADGDFGSETENALKLFQEENNLSVSGIYDKATDLVLRGSSSTSKVVITGNSVFIRNEPNTDGLILGVAHQGDVFPYLLNDSEYGWHSISYMDEIAWVSGKFSRVEK